MGLLAALRFLTILPLPGGGAADERTLGRATGWYPLAGLLVGAILAGGWLLALRLWSASAAAAAGVILWTIVTRGFHLDGLADTFDGIGGGATRERRLAIMKDSRVGVFGVLAVALCLLGKYAFLAELGGQIGVLQLAAVPVLGRWAMLVALFSFPSAAGSGLGRAVKSRCRAPQLLLGTVTALAGSAVLLGGWGFVLAGVAAACALLLGALLTRLLGGLTGDSYGAVCEVSELSCLAVLATLGFQRAAG